ncbi:MAG: HNH endonuclease [Steroidobacteraceae bacterium]|nr:HNH endonuclease [Steroidobacteraceae bacterium]
MDGSYRTTEEALTTAELATRITTLCGQLNAATYRWLILIAEFDRREGWNDGGSKSCAHWLNWRCGLDLGAAREKLRVAHALASLPRIAAAMAAGELSYSKARALTRVAESATEGYLLEVARHGTAHHVERLVRAYRRALDAQELAREARQQAERRLTWHHDDDGTLVVSARLPAEAGALLLKALEAALDDMGPPDVSAETSSASQRRADALAAVAEGYLAGGPAALAGGDRQRIVVHVDAEVLATCQAGRCELEEGPALAAETARRLSCDASLVRITEDARGQPLDIGRRTRSIPPALRRALDSRDRGCRFPGCTQTRHVDGHHIHHWADGGETKLANLVLLCRFHHRMVHEGRVAVERLDDGYLRFLRADGHAFDAATPSETPAASRIPVNEWPPMLPPAALWRGERMDYGLAVDCLLARRSRGLGVSAETSTGSAGAPVAT